MPSRKSTPVCGVVAPPPHPTLLAAALVATALSVPVLVVSVAIEVLT